MTSSDIGRQRRVWFLEMTFPIRPAHRAGLQQEKQPKIAKNRLKIAILGQKREENGVFRRFFTIFHLRSPLRLVSVDDFLSEAYFGTVQARILCEA